TERDRVLTQLCKKFGIFLFAAALFASCATTTMLAQTATPGSKPQTSATPQQPAPGGAPAGPNAPAAPSTPAVQPPGTKRLPQATSTEEYQAYNAVRQTHNAAEAEK